MAWSTFTKSVSQVLISSSGLAGLSSLFFLVASTWYLQYSMTLDRIFADTLGTGTTSLSSVSAGAPHDGAQAKCASGLISLIFTACCCSHDGCTWRYSAADWGQHTQDLQILHPTPTVQDVFDRLGHEGNVLIDVKGLIIRAPQLDLRL